MTKKKWLLTSVFCAVASVGFVVSGFAEETVTHQLQGITIEGGKDVLPGGDG